MLHMLILAETISLVNHACVWFLPA